MLQLSSTPKMRVLTIGSFVVGVTLYSVGTYYAFANIAPQQEQLKARKEFVKEWLKRKTEEKMRNDE